MSARTKTAIFLIGVPGAGKSTWIQQGQAYKSKLITKDHYDTAWFCSSDDVIESIALTYGKTYDEAFSCIKFAELVFFDRIKRAVAQDESLIIDRTNMSVSSRNRVMSHIPGDYLKIAVVFPTPDTFVWRERLASRPGKNIPQNVLDSMVNNFQEPTKEEGFDVIFRAA
jgi:predicted kinase